MLLADNMKNYETLFGSAARMRLIQILFVKGRPAIHLRSLGRCSGYAIRTVQKEIRNLTELGLIRKTSVGNRQYFQANEQHPLYAAVATMVETFQDLKFSGLPGQELIRKGIQDQFHGLRTLASLLVEIGRPQLKQLGFLLPEPCEKNPELQLYGLLSKQYGDEAHSQYNAFIKRLVSFERAAACVN